MNLNREATKVWRERKPFGIYFFSYLEIMGRKIIQNIRQDKRKASALAIHQRRSRENPFFWGGEEVQLRVKTII